MKFIPNAASVKLARSVLLARKHSPVIMFGTGLAGTVTATVLACRATLKLEDVLAEAEKKRGQIKEAVATKSDAVYSEQDAENDRRLLKVQTVVKLGKLYGPAIGVGVVSFGLLTGAHVVLTKRNAALTAAYVAVDKAFKEYRSRVRQELGDDKDREFRYGSIKKEIVEEGEHTHEVKTVTRIDPKTGYSMYAKWFGEGNPNWKSKSEYNFHFIRCVQDYANDRLQSRGHVFLNEIYDNLGFDHTKEGAIVGWVKGNGDNYIDFFLNDDRAVDFFTGEEDSVWLDFNVDGPIYNLI